MSEHPIRTLIPGVVLSATIALAATYIAEHHGAPAMLMALLLGMAFNYLTDNSKVAPGVIFSSRHILRIGVALLGVRITFAEINLLGVETVTLVVSGVIATVLVGFLIARLFGLSKQFSILSAGAVAICGASAALAIASVLPRDEKQEERTILVVAGVTTLSTLAMLVYPLLIDAFGLSNVDAGIFLGATIHDVAQVIGAGYTISQETGDTAAVVKLLRVICLMPVVLIIGIAFNRRTTKASAKIPIAPWFLVAFVVLVALNSFGLIPEWLRSMMSEAAQWGLVCAVAALGIRTSMEKLASTGIVPVLVLVLQSVFLVAFVRWML